MDVTREQTLRYRWRTQQLDEPTDSQDADVAILDIGVQSGAGDAARLALRNRGVRRAEARRVTSAFSDDLVLVWSLRGAPHFYRRAEVTHVHHAVSPVSAADAAKRSAGAARLPIDHLEALEQIGHKLHAALAEPHTKAEVSAAITPELPPELLVACRPCKATHCSEQLFRLSALHGGIELEPGTNPPVLRRIPCWRIGAGPGDPLAADRHLQVARAYVHFLGPATPTELAGFLDTSVTEAKKIWPDDLMTVNREGKPAWILPADADALAAAAQPGSAPNLRLLNGFDLFLAAKDRHLLTRGDRSRHQELWPVLGRPGAIVADGEILGTWRPRSSGARLQIRANWWITPTDRHHEAVAAAADVIAADHQKFAGYASA